MDPTLPLVPDLDGFRAKVLGITPVIGKPRSVPLSAADWDRGVRKWLKYCTSPRSNWARHADICERLVFPEDFK